MFSLFRFLMVNFFTLALFFSFGQRSVLADQNLSVVISEIAWSGTKASTNDEWLELFNTTDAVINLDGWGLYEKGGETLVLALKGEILPQSFYLIERTDDKVISDINADLVGSFGGNGLSNNGEYLVIKNSSGQIVDEVNFSSGWPAGTTGPDYKSMERINLLGQGSDFNNWITHSGINSNGLDSKDGLILGTPKRAPFIKQPNLTPETLTSTTSATGSLPNNVASEKSQNSALSANLNKPPIINLPDSIYLLVGEKLNLDNSLIQDPENETLTFNWNFGDGVISKDAKAVHFYLYPGRYTLTLSVKDSVNELRVSSIVNVYPKNIFINELMPNPIGRDQNNEWIELYNSNDFPVDISGYILETASDKFVIPEGTLLFEDSFLVLQNANTRLNLKNDNGVVRLLTPERFLLQEVNYQGLKEGFAVARKNDKYFFSQIPTPAATNIIYFKNDKFSLQKQPVISKVSNIATTSEIKNLNLVANFSFNTLKEPSQTQCLTKNKTQYIAQAPGALDLDDISFIKKALASRLEDGSLLASTYNQDIANLLKSNPGFNYGGVAVIILVLISSSIISYFFIYRRTILIKFLKYFR